MLHYEQMFGNVFERRESKCCAVLTKHRRKVKGEQVIIVQMDQKLKSKNISDVSGPLFCCQCHYFAVSVKINFCQRQTKCIDDQDKFQSVKDTDNEFNECGISPVSLHAFMKTLKSNISEV